MSFGRLSFFSRNFAYLLRSNGFDNQRISTTLRLVSSSSSKTGGMQKPESEFEKLKKGLVGEPNSLSTDYENETLFPSDLVSASLDQAEKKRFSFQNETLERHRQELALDDDATLILFPGQGAQFVGMGRRVTSTLPTARLLWEEASEVFGVDLLRACELGPKSTLDATRVCQPATVVTSLAALVLLNHDNPRAIKSCVATAGFSVGEYAALVFAGLLSYSDMLRVLKVRCSEMQRLSERIPSGMLSVITARTSTKLADVCAAAREHVAKSRALPEPPICSIGNYLFADGRVIAGHMPAIKFIEENAAKFGLKRAKMLPVSGAFHTPLMQGASESLRGALAQCTPFPDPTTKTHKLVPVAYSARVYANVDARPYQRHNRAALVAKLADQVWQPVQWEQLMHNIFDEQKTKTTKKTTSEEGERKPLRTFELGPGKQLGAMLKSINLKAYARYNPIEV